MPVLDHAKDDKVIHQSDRPMSEPQQINDDESTPSKAPRRACDCCRKRKVKCDGGHACGPCKRASIRCTYLQAPKKKGPKGLRSAKVLHALRQMDDEASTTSSSPLSPGAPSSFAHWEFAQPNAFPRLNGRPSSKLPGRALESDSAMGGLPVGLGPPRPTTSLPPLSHLDLTRASAPAANLPNIQSHFWPTYSDPVGADGSGRPVQPSESAELLRARRVPGESFLPYMRLFYSHMFPIMPIIDREIYLDPDFYSNSSLWSSDTYCFLCAICAATVVQLDASIPQPPRLDQNKPTDDVFAGECLRERTSYDYIEPASTLSVMTSFFLFAYHGNHERHGKAWHYLQESITFSETLNMDIEDTYAKLNIVEAQWRRRLYWLLFITERAYAVQRRKQTRLHAGVHLPAVFESEDPQLLNGFVNLANLFSAVGDDFVRAWRGSRSTGVYDEAWLADVQKQLDAAAVASGNVTETQKLDINVTREWLHVLAWQMGVSNGFIWGKGEAGMRLDYPIELARKVVEITSSADALALDSHGIGMEQKLADIAGCLADVLKCTAGDTSSTFVEGKHYLSILLQRLSSIRGRESRYLKPLMSKVEGIAGYAPPDTQSLPHTTDTTASLTHGAAEYQGAPRLSLPDSVGMLRTLSMSGALGMPTLTLPLEDWSAGNIGGKMYNETDANDLLTM